MQQASFRRTVLPALLLLLLTGCGYQSPYGKSNADSSENATVYVSVWKNNTNELGFDGAILQRIGDWLQESKHITLTAYRDDADYILSGSIDSIDLPATAFSGNDRATTLKARVTTSYQLVRRKTGEKVKTSQNAVREASYSVASDSVRTRSNKEVALATIANAIGEQIYLEVFYTLTGYQK
ncbi:MAG: hypothetical protein KKG47_12555 [Proteobacteria bacterium]|nr:hypothetical protein [Pseudomonadota bacterium]MBU1738683.1 hypothetical protein [Pseudomonadota bacterium]